MIPLHLSLYALLVAQAAGPGAEAPPNLSEFPGQFAPTPPGARYPVWPSGCKRFEGEERVNCLEAIAFDFGDLARFRKANEELAPRKNGEHRVVFMGDSITDLWSNPKNGGFFPGEPYINRGIGGQTTGQMLLRFKADVLQSHPEVVVILAGTNDIGGNAGPVTERDVEDNLEVMAELAKCRGIRVVMASILPVRDDKKDAQGHPHIWSSSRRIESVKSLNAWMIDYAGMNGHVYLDYFSAMVDAQGSLKTELTEDGLHPNRAGYAVMSPLAQRAIAEALGTEK